MLRKIIKIDKEKCNGCGLCAKACHEGAIEMIEGKAVLTREDYCDGLGDCLPACPTGAITFEEREAPAYDHAAVTQNKIKKEEQTLNQGQTLPCGCPGSQSRALKQKFTSAAMSKSADSSPRESMLSQWPVQIKLAPVNAPYFKDAKLLIAADCSAYAFGDFHDKFMKGKVTLIGCPKLDEIDYSEKLSQIIRINDIKSVTVVRMEVPCCGGLENAVKKAILTSGKFLPWQVVTLSVRGEILE